MSLAGRLRAGNILLPGRIDLAFHLLFLLPILAACRRFPPTQQLWQDGWIMHGRIRHI